MRRRAVTAIAATTHTTTTESVALLNTPSWRVSTWRKAPAVALLSRPGTAPPADDVPPPAPHEAAARQTEIGTHDDRSTRLS